MNVQAVTIVYYENLGMKDEAERWTHNHWHGRLETYPIRYPTRTTVLEWQTDGFIRTASCKAVKQCNKLWN